MVPLLLIFLGSTGFAADRDAGRVKLSLVQGASARAMAGGQVLALWGLGLALLLWVVLVSVATSAMWGGPEAVDWTRLAGFVAAHVLFLGTIAAGVVAASLWSGSARSSLLVLLAVWVGASALLPRATAGAAAARFPLPSQDAFQAAMRASREAGPDGHNPEDEAIERRKQEILGEYGVASVEELPIDFGGIAMQMDEAFGNEVWDTHYGELRARLARQRSVMTAAAAFNPFQAIDHISMAFTGTDLAHDLDFQLQAEAHRRALVSALNHEHAYGGPKRRGEPWKASAEFYEGLAAFRYAPPAARDVARQLGLEGVALLMWTGLLLLSVRGGARRLEAGRLPC